MRAADNGSRRIGLSIFARGPACRRAPTRHPERLSLYEEQVRVAWEDGSLNKKERRMLDAARDWLGLGAEETASIEGRLAAEPSAPPTRPDRTASGEI